MEFSKLNIGDLVQIIDGSKYAIKTELGMYIIIEEHIGTTYTTYLAVLMFGEEQNRVWIFPSQENGVVSEVSDKTFIRWFDTEKNTPYAFNTIHRLLREGMIEIVSRT